MNNSYTIHHGDCLPVLSEMEDNSVDSIVTDPPYGLGTVKDIAGLLVDWVSGGDGSMHAGKSGFMGKSWDAAVPSPQIWREVYRVLKPGGHVACFAGTRTVDLMGVALRLAGFEIRDSLHWLYGSGFPKSLDIGKSIDREAGVPREVRGMRNNYRDGSVRTRRVYEGIGDEGKSGLAGKPSGDLLPITIPATQDAQQWDGWGTALKPAHEPIILARKPLSEKTVAANFVRWGTGGVNIDACRVPTGDNRDRMGGGAKGGNGVYGESKTYDYESHSKGRWPSNILLTHSPLCNDTCHESCPISRLGEQSGESGSTGHLERHAARPKSRAKGAETAYVTMGHSDSGTAARYFPQLPHDDTPFLYQAKASSRERNKDTTDNQHPTVKPVAVMRWLCRLCTPPGGIVLDPFAGSGTTGVAAIEDGFSPILIEREEEYINIARQRCDGAQSRHSAIRGNHQLSIPVA